MGTKAHRKHLARKGIKVEIIHCKPVAPPAQTSLPQDEPSLLQLRERAERLASISANLTATPRWRTPTTGGAELAGRMFGEAVPTPVNQYEGDITGFNQIQVVTPEGRHTVERGSSAYEEIENHMRDHQRYRSTPPESEGAFVEAQRQSVNASLRSFETRFLSHRWEPQINARASNPLTADMLTEVMERVSRTGSEYLGINGAMERVLRSDSMPSSQAGRIQALFGVALDPTLLDEPYGTRELELPYERISDINEGEEEA